MSTEEDPRRRGSFTQSNLSLESVPANDHSGYSCSKQSTGTSLKRSHSKEDLLGAHPQKRARQGNNSLSEVSMNHNEGSSFEQERGTVPGGHSSDESSTVSTIPAVTGPRQQSTTSKESVTTSTTTYTNPPSIHSNHSESYTQSDKSSRQPSPSSSVSSSTSSSLVSDTPPVTVATLRELDIPQIIHNPKLRHDVNFDSQLHFRPNLDGARGRKKKQQSELFWQALSGEYEDFLSGTGKQNPQKIPKVFESIRDILSSLVPDRDRQGVVEVLNIELILQQMKNGAYDFQRLASWMAGLLKAHCAPMRDEWVDEMKEDIDQGAAKRDAQRIIKGLKTLFGILEAMKLVSTEFHVNFPLY
jgi:T-complex protein 11